MLQWCGNMKTTANILLLCYFDSFSVKPVLKKVSKTEASMARLGMKGTREGASFRGTLKSTGQNKFALEEKEEHVSCAVYPSS